MNLNNSFKYLVESLKLVCSSYEEQKKYLPKFVEIQDEVVATFTDAFLLMPQLVENNFLSIKAIAFIIRSYNWMEIGMRNNETSNVNSFKDHDIWKKVRESAKEALKAMDVKNGKPDLYYLNSIE
ncbi:MAG: hypothetical protein PVH88_15065 [Ignavibacteria bacterium]|jgi:hypothetical protein